MQENHYCLMFPIPELRRKEVCLMCRWVPTTELKCVSSWAHICYMYYLKNTAKTITGFIGMIIGRFEKEKWTAIRTREEKYPIVI